MELGKRINGLHEKSNMEMVLCALRLPSNDIDKILYELYISAGSKSEDTSSGASGYSAYRPCVSSVGNYGVQYNPEDNKNYIPWNIPQWALSLADKITRIIYEAENIGKEQGYSRGLRDGKSFVRQLANGNLSMRDFDPADGRDDCRLGRKKW